MIVSFYRYGKRSNSTRYPNYDGINVDCAIFEPCDILAPKIIVSATYAVIGRTYCRITSFNRYYFINNWRFENGRYIAECAVDVLASWRSEILASQQYVIRSASDYNGNITDALYPLTAKVTSADNAYDERPFSATSLADGSYVVGILGGNSTSPGAATYYVMTQSQFDSFRAALLSDLPTNGEETAALEISDTLGKMIYNPLQYVVSCVWFPFSVPTGTDASADLKVGYFPLANVTAKTLNAAGVWDTSVKYAVPQHPLAASRGNYLNSPMFSRHVLDLFPFGEININGLESGEGITCSIEVDCVTGNAQMWIIGDNMRKIYTGQVGVPIQLAQVSRDFSAGNVYAGAAIGAYTGYVNDGIGGAIVGAANGIAQTAFTPSVDTLGEQGSLCGYRRASVIHSEFFYPADENNAENGRPLMSTATLSTLTGFVQCERGDIALTCTDTERQMISRFLTSGFFIE